MSGHLGSSDVRVSIFIDYWNFVSSLNECEANFQSDWTKVSKVILTAVQALDQSIPVRRHVYQGMRVVGSFDPDTEAGRKSKNWATTFLSSRVPGCTVHFVERQRKKAGPKCPACRSVIQLCPTCSTDMRGTEEKGVDTRIATEMISHAWENAYDIAVIVSADRDFVPVAEFLQAKGKTIIHAGFPPKGAFLRQACWGGIDLSTKMDALRKL